MSTIGLLCAGDVGTAFGLAASKADHRVVTAVAGRSEATKARRARFNCVAMLADVVDASDLVVSITAPRAAGARELLLIDANAVERGTMRQIQASFEHSAARLVNGVVRRARRDHRRCEQKHGARSGHLRGHRRPEQRHRARLASLDKEHLREVAP